MGRGKSRRSLELADAAVTILKEIQPASVRAVFLNTWPGISEHASKYDQQEPSA